MTTWKRGTVLLAVLGLSLSLNACGSSAGLSSSVTEEPSVIEEEITPVDEETFAPEESGESGEEAEAASELELHGLVIVKESYHTNEKEYVVFCWNPDAGQETVIADFEVPYQTSSGDIYAASAVGLSVSRSSFSSDYSKLSGQVILAANGERHAGWHNTDGSYTDVTVALGQQSKSDFEDPVYYRSMGFAGDNFGYAHSSDGAILNERHFYLPADDLSTSAIQEGNVHEAGHPFDQSGHLLPGKYGTGDYLASEVSSWIDDTHAIVNSRKIGSCASYIVDTTAQTESTYIPGDSRNNWNGVISPDGTKIAFMSEPKNGVDVHTDIYIIPVGGGDPVKVEGHSYDLQGISNQTQKATCNLIGWI